jgi:multidrug efflux pump subunit AcrA (membrane-fusion protein)
MAGRTSVAATVTTGLLAFALTGCNVPGADDPADAASPETSLDTATVTRRDLTDATTATGELDYGEARDLVSLGMGTVTALPPAGRVVRNGRPLYYLDTVPVLRLEGRVPAWRDLGPSVSDGPDVRQLERALTRLGYADDLGMGVDGDWTWVTTIAVERLQEDLGLDEDGELPLGRVVFTPEDVRVVDQLVDVGAQVAPGTAVLQVGDTHRAVAVSLDTTQKHLAPVGGKVGLSFPDGTDAHGVVTDVENVPGDETTAESLAVTVELPDGKRAAKDRAKVAEQLDGTSVQVEFTETIAEDVLAVPVTALVALGNGGYGVETVAADGSTSYVAVTPGSFSDTQVAIADGDLTEGDEVVVTP